MAFEIKDGILIKCDEKNGDIVIPEGVTSIQEEAFSGFNKYHSISLPDSLVAIANKAFGYSKFSEVHISSLEKWIAIKFDDLFCSPLRDGANLIISGKALEELYIPEGTTAISNYRFEGCLGLRKVIIPEGVTEIGECAFRGCSDLAEICLPNSLKKIGYAAFDGCGLQTVSIPDNVEEIEHSTFANCKELTELKLPETMSSIPGGMVKGCRKLKDFVFPKMITEIKNTVFCQTGIERITLPSTLTRIDKQLFMQSSLVEINIHEGITEIDDQAFNGCRNLEKVSLPKSLKRIGKKVFENCQIKELIIPSIQFWFDLEKPNDSILETILSNTDLIIGDEKVTELNLDSGIDSIPNYMFSGCSSLVHLTIPEGIKHIGSYAFKRCCNLETVEIIGDTEIGEEAFAECEKLKNVVLSNDIKETGISVFSRCKALQSINIPSSMVEIPGKFLAECSSLEHIEIPNTVKRIRGLCFSNCTSLTEVIIPDSVNDIVWGAFQGCRGLKHVSLPQGLSTYTKNLFEKTGFEEFIIPEGVETLEDYVFRGCSELKVLSIPSSLKNIGYGAFDDLGNLEKLILNCNLTRDILFRLPDSKSIKEVYIHENQIEEAKYIFKKVQFYNLDGEMIGKPAKTATAEKAKSQKKSSEKSEKKAPEKKKSSEKVVANTGITVMYPDGFKADNKAVEPIIYDKGKPKGFAKPDISELTVEMDGTEFFIMFKVASKVPSMWKRYYAKKDKETIYDPEEALSKAYESSGFIHESTGDYVTSPLQYNIPDDATPLSSDEIEKRLCKFVKIINQCVQEESIKKIMKNVQKKKNGKLYKGRVLTLSYLDLVDEEGTTFSLVAKNDDDIQLSIELRNKVPVVDDLLDQETLF